MDWSCVLERLLQHCQNSHTVDTWRKRPTRDYLAGNLEAEMGSVHHGWGMIQRLTAYCEKLRKFVAALQDSTRRTGRLLLSRSPTKNIDGFHTIKANSEQGVNVHIFLEFSESKRMMQSASYLILFFLRATISQVLIYTSGWLVMWSRRRPGGGVLVGLEHRPRPQSERLVPPLISFYLSLRLMQHLYNCFTAFILFSNI